MTATLTHATLVNRLLAAVSPLGLAWPNQTGAVQVGGRLIRYGLKGSPDILACVRGRMIGIEAKVGRDAHRPAQRRFAAALDAAGGLYVIARSTDGTGDDAIVAMREAIGDA